MIRVYCFNSICVFVYSNETLNVVMMVLRLITKLTNSYIIYLHKHCVVVKGVINKVWFIIDVNFYFTAQVQSTLSHLPVHQCQI